MEFIENAVGRKIPKYIDGVGVLKPYRGPFATRPEGKKYAPSKAYSTPGYNKILTNIREAIEKTGLKDGMTISFHHHLREGDYILNAVVDQIAKMGIKNITICASSLNKVHEPLIEHIKNGVITGLQTSGLRGKLAKEISTKNILGKPVIFRTHGGRARAIEAGDVKIDVAFLGASACDKMGNMNGVDGKSAFGAIGYAMVDAEYADKVVAITDNLVEYPLYPISISQTLVDYVVVMDEIGNPSLISSGATRVTKNPLELTIAENAARAIIDCGYIKNGFSFQAGSGGSALAVVKFVKEYMEENNIVGSFASGGISSYMVNMLESGLFKALFDTQTFDCEAGSSLKRNHNHIEMSASTYANPHNKGCVAHQLDVMILSATEIDINFNVNVMTGSTGIIMGAQGGHPDTAAGAKFTVVVAPLMRKRIPIVVDEVTTVVTPGETVDVVVTERGIAINPRRTDIIEKLSKSNLPIMTIKELKNLAESFTGIPEKPEFDEEIVGIVEYRDGTIMDVIRKVKQK
ncbi:citrate lyase subunit alpha [Clostridium sp.]|uniref:citrate lyase subunit alpha n=1 Tax=Clostridium sp. TaxID=1506 RepID=UPI003D6C9864